ncbi:general secretion pathway protein K [alpha proteobacterium U9-1i]|nr:general secretion pathway protein K [alpha proteobacterium U9-1i]
MMLVAAVTIAALALAVMVAARAQTDLGPALRRLSDEVRLEAAAQTAEARVAFLLTTEPVGLAAIEVGGDRNLAQDAAAAETRRGIDTGAVIRVRLDGLGYGVQLGQAQALVSIQDEAGLLNLNAADETATRALLAYAGAARVAPLAAALVDYIDADDLQRASGAEADDYARAGLAGPANAPLRTRTTALEVLGWRAELSGASRGPFFNWTSAQPATQALNVNTAPAEVLRARLNLDARTTRTLIAHRERTPFLSLDEIEGFAGAQTRADAAPIGIAPGTRFRITTRLINARGGAQSIHESQLVVANGESSQPVYWRQGAVRREDRGAVSRGMMNGIEFLPNGRANFPS